MSQNITPISRIPTQKVDILYMFECISYTNITLEFNNCAILSTNVVKYSTSATLKVLKTLSDDSIGFILNDLAMIMNSFLPINIRRDKQNIVDVSYFDMINLSSAIINVLIGNLISLGRSTPPET